MPATAALLAQSPAVAEAALERLVDVRLAEEAGPGRYRLRELLWLFARQKAGNRRPLKISELVNSRTEMDLMRAALGEAPVQPAEQSPPSHQPADAQVRPRLRKHGSP